MLAQILLEMYSIIAYLYEDTETDIDDDDVDGLSLSLQT
jgi:hypothetical protein